MYYGKQESGVSKTEIEQEMDLLNEEINEKQKEGEVLLAMDGNGKVGILGERISRNGEQLLKVFADTDMNLLNKSSKCKGKITRQNTQRKEEYSAIDLILCNNSVTKCIKEIIIDEEGMYKISGSKDTDHNTITIKMDLSHIKNSKTITPTWRINAPAEKWAEFRGILDTINFDMEKNMESSLTEVYHDWQKCIESAAFCTIGKTSKNKKGHTSESAILKYLRKERRDTKKTYELEQDQSLKPERKLEYITAQGRVKTQMEIEEKEKTEDKVRKILSGNKNLFWKERSDHLRNNCDEWNITKDQNGKRLFDPFENKSNIANYYENLYQKPICKHHPYHNEVIECNNINMEDMRYENNDLNREPTIEEVKEIIKNKKNRKSTSDLKNEILKRGGDSMVRLVYPLVLQFWRTEQVADQWNNGHITSVYKQRGDREELKNQRGITVSSSVGTIPEEIIDKRINKVMKFSQFQAGGRKGCSTVDHIFIIRGIISYALHLKKRIFITMFDVEKAYDRADIQDMMHIAWKDGVRGKLWRLMRVLNTELTANVNTKYGKTRKIHRESGGKQGGKIIVTLFSRLMDTLSEELGNNVNAGILINEQKLNDLLYVDDALTLAEGKKQQVETLKSVDEFATKHKIKWGASKCKVLEIGKHTNPQKSWKLGELEIEGADTYKYLGDYICRKGNNRRNIEERCNKMKVATREIINCGTSTSMKYLNAKILIELHETISIPSLLNNGEAWLLTGGDLADLEKAEIWSLKRILNLPPKTPTAAIKFETGTLLMDIRIDKMQLIYLHKVLQRQADHWTQHILNSLDQIKIGWAEEIRKKLLAFNLDTNWEEIAKKSHAEWKIMVTEASEKENKQRLLNLCYKDRTTEKTKTKYVIQK